MQGLLMELGRGITQAMYLTPPRENFEAFLGIVDPTTATSWASSHCSSSSTTTSCQIDAALAD